MLSALVQKSLLGFALFGLSVSVVQATPVAWSGTYNAIDQTGVGVFLPEEAQVTGYIDVAAGTFLLTPTQPLLGAPLTSSVGTLFGPGSYTFNVNGDGSNEYPSGSGDYNVTVGAGQLGGWADFTFNFNTGIDVFLVWNVVDVGGMRMYTTADGDGNGYPGIPMIDGPFYGYSPVFDMAHAVPLPASTWLLGSGLLGLFGLVKSKIKRRE